MHKHAVKRVSTSLKCPEDTVFGLRGPLKRIKREKHAPSKSSLERMRQPAPKILTSRSSPVLLSDALQHWTIMMLWAAAQGKRLPQKNHEFRTQTHGPPLYATRVLRRSCRSAICGRHCFKTCVRREAKYCLTFLG